MKWVPIKNCLMCPFVVVSHGEYTTVACVSEDCNDPYIISCDIHNVNIPKWCPLLDTNQLILAVQEEMKANKPTKSMKDKTK